jgi:MFS family permease
MIPFGFFQLIFGPFADRYGKKQVVAFSILVFAFTTALCAFGTGLKDLSLYRALTGVFAAAVMPISLALIGDLFPIEERQTAFGIMTLVGGKLSGKLTSRFGARNLLTLGLALVALSDAALYRAGSVLWILMVSVGLLGAGFLFTHSTLLTRATQFAQKSRGAAMSLVAFCFMGGGGIGTAVGAGIIAAYGISNLSLAYAAALFLTLFMSFVLIRGQVVPLRRGDALANAA